MKSVFYSFLKLLRENNTKILAFLYKTTFEILPKETVAFVGESGCGKSTIINLIAHLYYKNGGDILFDDVKIEDLSREFVKENIAVVNQFPYIFNMNLSCFL